jgi:hypothetical protein
LVTDNVQLGFVVVLKRKLKTSFSKCVKGDCWENVVRKQRWFHNSRRSRAGRWEKSSHRAIFPNGFRLCDGAAKYIKSFYYKLNFKISEIFKLAKIPHYCKTDVSGSVFNQLLIYLNENHMSFQFPFFHLKLLFFYYSFP